MGEWDSTMNVAVAKAQRRFPMVDPQMVKDIVVIAWMEWKGAQIDHEMKNPRDTVVAVMSAEIRNLRTELNELRGEQP